MAEVTQFPCPAETEEETEGGRKEKTKRQTEGEREKESTYYPDPTLPFHFETSPPKLGVVVVGCLHD